jgi:hypothetical protein
VLHALGLLQLGILRMQSNTISECSLKWTECSLKWTDCSLNWTKCS